MILESKYLLYQEDTSKEIIVIIQMGRVYFDRNVVISKKRKTETSIKRTDNKNRQRANPSERHGTNVLVEIDSGMKLTDIRDFEWLAWNYRTYKMQQLFLTKKGLVLSMYTTTFSFLPTPEEILNSIIKA